MGIIDGWKVFRIRKDGTLGPLFINARLRVPVGKWIKAEAHRTKGFAFRPGWHATLKKSAPHLRTTGDRVWCQVKLKGISFYDRPESQGGRWVLAQSLMVERICASGE